MVRYWDGHRWTFHTAVRRTVVLVEASRAIRRRRRSPPCGPTFDALVGAAGDSTPAGDGAPAAVLLDRISALRHHRADCSAATGGAGAAADRMAARPYRPLQPSARQSLLDALRALPS